MCLCQQSYCRGAGVRRPSVKGAFSETIKGIDAIYHISRPFFAVLQNLIWTNFFFIFVNMNRYESETFKTLLPLQLQLFFNQTFFSTISLWQSSQNLLIRIFEIWKKLTFPCGFHGTLWEWKFQKATPPIVFSTKLPIHTKLDSWNFEISNLNLKKTYKIEIWHCGLWENAIHVLSITRK